MILEPEAKVIPDATVLIPSVVLDVKITSSGLQFTSLEIVFLSSTDFFDNKATKSTESGPNSLYRKVKSVMALIVESGIIEDEALFR